MRYSAVLFLILAFTLTAFSQPRNPKTKPKPKAAPTVTADEKNEFEKAIGETDPVLKIAALQKFIQNFPNSKDLVRAQESIVSVRGILGDNALKAGDTANGIEFFKTAVKDAPVPMSEKLFADIIIQFPTNLFLRGERDAARDIATMIEEKAGNDTKQIIALAAFYIGIENATNARRLAQKAIEIAPENPVAYQTLGIANRLGFRIDEAVAAYTKALELDPNSAVSKRSLAEMKRANGKADEATTLYREILEKNSIDESARTGLILSLFESGKQLEAESEMQKSLAVNERDIPLLVGAAYFYASKNDGAKAVELAQKALAIEPRYTWASIALARGFMAQKKPLEAEKVLLAARAFGNFPTLDYEIASARLQAGLYREAADELRKHFTVKDGLLGTYLGNRIGVDAEDFLKLLSLERRAAIFSFEAADTTENAEQLKSLLEFSEELRSETANETLLSQSADRFVNGEDKMKIHRQLFIAGRLLDTKKNLQKIIELTQGAIKGVNTALDVPNPSAAIMADEIYNARQLAASRNEFLLVPEVPRQTLSAILRGRIEDLSGWTLYQQDKSGEAVVKLKRAVSVLPENSSWWRSSIWRLGSALEADGKSNEALENYIKSYKDGEASAEKYTVIDVLYQKVKGNRDGLEDKIGKPPGDTADTVAKITETPTPEPEVTPTPEISPTPQPQENVVENTEKVEEPNTSTTETSTQTETPAQTKTVISPTTETPDSETPTTESSPTPTPEPTPTAEENSINSTIENSTTETVTTPVSENPTTVEPTSSPEPTTSEIQNPEPTNVSTETTNSQTSNPAPTNSETIAKNDLPKNSIFDPVVIVVGKSQPAKTETEKPGNPVLPQPTTKEIDLPTPIESENPAPKKKDEVSSRPRVIIEDNLKTAETPKCELIASQESVWLINGGGSLGVLVGYAGKGDASKITGVSSSPNDVEVSIDSEISAVSGRAFFILKSISTKKGAFTITFNSPCGKTEVQVSVR